MTTKYFYAHCNSPIIFGYRLCDGERVAANHQELVELVSHRIHLDESDCTVRGLSKWLMSRRINERAGLLDCDRQDLEHASAVVLMAELSDPDTYVAGFPEDGGMQSLPPSEVVRQLIEAERLIR